MVVVDVFLSFLLLPFAWVTVVVSETLAGATCECLTNFVLVVAVIRVVTLRNLDVYIRIIPLHMGLYVRCICSFCIEDPFFIYIFLHLCDF